MHWAHNWIGKKYPGFRCWKMVVDVQWEEFNLVVPAFEEYREPSIRRVRKIQEETQGPHWQEIVAPVDGSVATIGGSAHAGHVGVYADVDDGRILHTVAGTVHASDLSWFHRNQYHLTFYQYVSSASSLP